jgi:hypothetical protein
VKTHFSLFGDSANLDASQLHGLRRPYHWLRNYFGRTRWNYQVMWVMYNFISFCIEILTILMLDRCTVCAEHNIGSKIILDAPDGTPG